ncbi:hypothetical protein C5C18_01350 [Rathayibacter tritici]|uniref:hypothetical protein n=1 Tax=Rathayibacter tritici TaxID=33888 RepID=UPI0008347A96|nr:hypothetical protein [Rathayibacter tritici]PPF30572.1 hypothetical protein C5C06_04870 [Rathayibacter tritici]PPF66673.1 hypothetical protein C5C21_08365 [Rathayibacter tritici]PPG09058.1 hypothetical protein C5C18_01350 [Rathayibacter tritici]PPI17870.1 hypothetical protein C5D07_04265 [Rathayibacter tritici]PPI47146.1 hypothetical protein C5D18_04255 [Rathayibacter tritici]
MAALDRPGDLADSDLYSVDSLTGARKRSLSEISLEAPQPDQEAERRNGTSQISEQHEARCAPVDDPHPDPTLTTEKNYEVAMH